LTEQKGKPKNSTKKGRVKGNAHEQVEEVLGSVGSMTGG